jgi:uncharacterized membrane protein
MKCPADMPGIMEEPLMTLLIIVLRVIHIFSGVIWFGAAYVNVFFLQPTVQATGAEGQKVIQYQTQHTRFTITIYPSATLTLLSGIILYGILFGFRPAVLSSGYGLWISIGGLTGLIAWFVVMFVVRGITGRMQAIGGAIQSQGTPPSADQTEQLKSLSIRLVRMGRYGLVFLTIALMGMAIAQYT